MPRRSKSGQAVKRERQGPCQAIEALPHSETQSLPKDNDRNYGRPKGDAEAFKLSGDPSSEASESVSRSPEATELEQLKVSVRDLDHKIAELARKLSALEYQPRPSSNQMKKAACQDCQTEFVRMSVYMHGKKIMLEYCPKCVPDPLLIMKD